MPAAQRYGYDTVAITDHGSMYGVLTFYEQATKAGLKPIIGCEIYVAPGDRRDKNARSAKEAAYHLVLLAKDMEGYKNLLKLASLAQLEGFYYKPRVDMGLLEHHNAGLIALSACLHGEVPHALIKDDFEAARQKAVEYSQIFKNRFYLELQENGIPEQTKVNQGLIELSKELGLGLVATADCHYLNSSDAYYHDVLLCIQTQKTVHDQNRMRFSTDQLYFASPEEMARKFAYCPEALKNTVDIASACNLTLSFKNHYFPRYPIDPGLTYEEVFEKRSRDGLEKRLLQLKKITADVQKPYRDRMEMELQIIKDKGFASYFLIVADFIQWAKNNGVPVGPGRGSAAGSLVAYSLDITNIDPVEYGLFFERFLNAERTSLPDIDVDFCMSLRDRVLQYVTEKYGGSDHVAQIITFGQMKAKAVIRDVGRALAVPLPEVDKIAKLVPESLKMTIAKALEEEPRLKELYEKEPRYKELLTVAQALEGLPRHSSTHAAGVVISDKPMMEYLPLARGQKGETLTQFDMKWVEKAGLIKFDFLGLKTLTVIDLAIKIIKKHIGEHVDIDSIPLDDEDTYTLLTKGDTTGVFQLESSGMKELLKRMKPTVFTDLIALVALYRPGPLESGMVTQFVESKHGRREVTYPLPELEPILKETYGVIVYQEQVMQIAQALAGYSLGEGDLLRRAIGKKKLEEMAAQRERFLSGAIQKGIAKDKAEYIFDLMEKFAGYGFNKSHSAAYALIAYQTAWLKTHYRAPFLASLLSNELGNTDGVVKFLQECKYSDIKVLPPDINLSEEEFTLEDKAIRFGLVAVKNVGSGAIQGIVEERQKNGAYKGFLDFCARVDGRKVNKRVVESLIACGAFDRLGHNRATLMASVETALEQGQNKKKRARTGTIGLFDGLCVQESSSEGDNQYMIITQLPEWQNQDLLFKEKQALGFYLSGHPLNPYMEQLESIATNTSHLHERQNGSKVFVAGVVSSKKEITTKKGDKMAFLTVEDVYGSVEVVCFPEVFAKTRDIIASDAPVLIEGDLQKEEKTAENEDEGAAEICKVLATSIEPLDVAIQKKISSVVIEINTRTQELSMQAIKKALQECKGEYPVRLSLVFPDIGRVSLMLPDSYRVCYNQALDFALGCLSKAVSARPVFMQ